MGDIQNETGKHTDFTPQDISEYLRKFRKLIINGKYTVSKNKNRRENIEFIEDYKINTRKEKEILLDLQVDDFCYAVDNVNEGFEHEILYIFCKSQELDYWGTLEDIDIYIKINMTETRRGDDFAIVISFHKRNKPIEYLFK